MRRRVLVVLLVLYAVTWVFGTPMIANHYAEETLHFYIINSRADGEYRNTYEPRFNFTASFPILPFVLLSRHEHRYGNLGGAGGWFLTVWYGNGIKEFHVLGWKA